MHITITGDLGSGKSTVCKVIEEKFGYEAYSTGKIQRKIAEEHGMTTLEFNKFMKGKPEFDNFIDDEVVKISKNKKDENIIFDSRMAWHFVDKSFKVYVIANVNVAASRVMNVDRGKVEKYTSQEDAKNQLLERKNVENNRFFKIYNVDCYDLDNYDLVIDSSYATPDEIAKLIIDRMKDFVAGNSFTKYWLSAKCLYPTIDLQIITAGAEAEDVEVARVKFDYFVIGGHGKVADAITNNINLIPAKLVEKDGRDLVMSRMQYADQANLSDYYKKWEDANSFKFFEYPEL